MAGTLLLSFIWVLEQHINVKQIFYKKKCWSRVIVQRNIMYAYITWHIWPQRALCGPQVDKEITKVFAANRHTTSSLQVLRVFETFLDVGNLSPPTRRKDNSREALSNSTLIARNVS